MITLTLKQLQWLHGVLHWLADSGVEEAKAVLAIVDREIEHITGDLSGRSEALIVWAHVMYLKSRIPHLGTHLSSGVIPKGLLEQLDFVAAHIVTEFGFDSSELKAAAAVHSETDINSMVDIILDYLQKKTGAS